MFVRHGVRWNPKWHVFWSACNNHQHKSEWLYQWGCRGIQSHQLADLSHFLNIPTCIKEGIVIPTGLSTANILRVPKPLFLKAPAIHDTLVLVGFGAFWSVVDPNCFNQTSISEPTLPFHPNPHLQGWAHLWPPSPLLPPVPPRRPPRAPHSF